jgi:hypothetical protein
LEHGNRSEADEALLAYWMHVLDVCRSFGVDEVRAYGTVVSGPDGPTPDLHLIFDLPEATDLDVAKLAEALTAGRE